MQFCLLCKSKDVDVISVKRGSLTMQKCCNCGFQSLLEMPNSKNLSSHYDCDYYGKWGFVKEKEPAWLGPMKMASANNIIDKLASLCHPGKILDIGCGMGYALEVAKKRGWDIYGVEISDFAFEIAHKKLGDNIKLGTLEKVNFPDNHFSVILMLDLLEHLKDPCNFMREISRLLMPNGIVVIITPNLTSFSAIVMRNNWANYLAEHLSYFSPKTIRILLRKNGFEILETATAFKYLNYNYIVSVMNRYNIPVLTALVKLINNLLPGWLKSINFRLGTGDMFVVAKLTDKNKILNYKEA